MLKLVVWAYLSWLLFCVPVEGRVWARHIAELWALPPVQAKLTLAKRQIWGVLARLRAALPEPSEAAGPTGAGPSATRPPHADLDRSG